MQSLASSSSVNDDEEEEVLLEIKNLCKYYPVLAGLFRKEVGAVKALDGVSVTVRRGETIGIVGESGCGKTTLGKTLMMLQKPTAGEIFYHFPDGAKDLVLLNQKQLMDFRHKVQMVFQDPYSSLNPVKKIFDSFDEPLRLYGFGNAKERKKIICQKLEMVNLKADYMYRYPHEFSGGQRQRICIARALCIDPEVVICDEPVSSLDVSIQAQVLNLMKDIQKELRLTYVFIAHDLSVVQYMSDSIMVMYLGKVVEMAESERLCHEPKHPYTEALLSAVPIPSIDVKKNRIILEGDVPSPINRPSGCSFHNRCKYCMSVCKTTEPRLESLAGHLRHLVACHLYDMK
jgi:oligopeptide/dipeptide ABC transporter ATP-binding protein